LKNQPEGSQKKSPKCGEMGSNLDGLLPESIFCERKFWLFSKFGLIYAQPMISAIWQGKSFCKVRQNRAILLASGLNRLSHPQGFVLLACSTAFAATRICNAVAGALTSFKRISNRGRC
jgi:hypothetical protein